MDLVSDSQAPCAAAANAKVLIWAQRIWRLKRQVPGRVGDAAVAGGAVYADSEVGACGSTGDGDAHLRFLPCFQARPLQQLP